MDSTRRIFLPKALRDITTTDFKNSVALCLEDDKLFFLQAVDQLDETSLVVDVVRVDNKGRFCLAKNIISHYQLDTCTKEFIFVQGRKIYISFS